MHWHRLLSRSFAAVPSRASPLLLPRLCAPFACLVHQPRVQPLRRSAPPLRRGFWAFESHRLRVVRRSTRVRSSCVAACRLGRPSLLSGLRRLPSSDSKVPPPRNRLAVWFGRQSCIPTAVVALELSDDDELQNAALRAARGDERARASNGVRKYFERDSPSNARGEPKGDVRDRNDERTCAWRWRRL